MDNSNITEQLDNLAQPQARRYPLPLQLGIAAAIIIIAAALGWYYLSHPLKTARSRRIPVQPLIEVQRVHPCSVPYSFHAMGTVEADKFVEIKPRVGGSLDKFVEMKPRVGGSLLSVNAQFTPGGLLQQDEIIATIDPTDYQLAVDRLQGEEARAAAELSLERGKRLVAEKEFELLGKEVSDSEKALMLRIPQLNAAKAALISARAQKKLAAEDLAHTQIRAPFTAVVIDKTAAPGSRVTPATTIGSLVGAERFRIRLAIPERQLQWIQTGANPSTVRIRVGSSERFGTITHIASSLEEGSRMALIYATVDDPLCLSPDNSGKPQLLLGSLVEAEIIGARLDNVIPLDRNQLADESSVFVLDNNDRPVLRPVEIAARNRGKVFISAGISDGEAVVVSGLASLKGKEQKAADGQ